MSISHLAVLVLVVATTSAQQQQEQKQPNQRSQDDTRSIQQRRLEGDIDAVPSDIPLLQLTKDDVTNLMNNPKSVGILTRCVVKPTNCKSASAYNITNQMNSFTIAGGKCKECTPVEEKYLDDLMYIFVQGYISRYTDQWRLIYPHVKLLVAASTQRGR